MKKLLSTLLLMVCALGAQAQNTTNDTIKYSFVSEVKANAKQVYQYAKMFLSANDEDFRYKVQIDDEESHRIQYAYTHETRMFSKHNEDFYVTEGAKMTIDGRDGKVRIKVESPMFVFSTATIKHIKMTYDEFIQDVVPDKIKFDESRKTYYQNLINKLVKYIETNVADENF